MDDFMFLPQTGHRNIIICLWFTQTNPKYNPSTSHILQALCFHVCTCSVGAALKRTRCSVWPDRRKYEKKKTTMQVLCMCANTSWADTFWCIHMYTAAGCTECAGTPCSPQSLKPLSWREGGWGGSRPQRAWPTYQRCVCGNLLQLRIDPCGDCIRGDVSVSVRLPPLIVSFFFSLNVESQWLHEQCRLRTADKPAGCRVGSPQTDPDVCVWTLSRNVSVRRQFIVFF